MAILCQIREDGSIADEWEIGELPLVVGRGDAADAHIEDESTSRRHSIIFREGEHYIIEDLGSQNGTWLDGRRVLAARLYPNARIVIGRTQFVFLDSQPSVLAAGQTPSRGREAPVRPGQPAFPAVSRGALDPGMARHGFETAH